MLDKVYIVNLSQDNFFKAEMHIFDNHDDAFRYAKKCMTRLKKDVSMKIVESYVHEHTLE